jgi:hypothetical protein
MPTPMSMIQLEGIGTSNGNQLPALKRLKDIYLKYGNFLCLYQQAYITLFAQMDICSSSKKIIFIFDQWLRMMFIAF